MFPLHYVIYVVIIGAAFTTGLYRLRRQRTIQPVVWLLGITACSEILCKALALTIHNNIPVYHVYQPIQLTLWAVFFYRNMRSGWRKTVVPLWLLLFLFSILNTLVIQPVTVFPGNFTKLESVVVMFWSFCLFSELLDLPARENIFLKSSFIVCIAVMWFNLVSYLFFGLFNDYVSAPRMLRSVWGIHLFSNYTYYSLLWVAMLLKAETPAYE
ncbi:hypothetical protein [Taibaiella koreensis]|uniref:hypothetical protein n=1 Tax=Taibaiella koreensis TaxID=1268548 RepID=UPI000E5A089C|nr:hypothetical protein [Taibaiella koreensis]